MLNSRFFRPKPEWRLDMGWPKVEPMRANALYAQVRWASARWEVDEKLLKAIILTESSGNPWVTKYEDKFVWLMDRNGRAFSSYDWFKRDKVAETDAMWRLRVRHRMEEELGPTEFHGQSQSWGLMQVMGAVARELGYAGPLGGLLLPSVNLEYGVKYMGRLGARWSDTDAVIAAYNAGSPRRNPDGTWENQPYVDKVLSHIQEA